MKIHREGYPTIIIVFILLSILDTIFYFIFPPTFFYLLLAISIIFFLFIISFFRDPNREFTYSKNQIIVPADGKVVVIEKTTESEYFKDERIQVSIFMSPANVHINRYPLDGVIQYVKYHPGKYLVAWHPKSSTENERNTVVLSTDSYSILIRQIAGKLARKIVCYSKPGEVVKQNTELGFIKFGSRVDLFLPLNSKIKVSLNEIVKGGQTILAEL
jgi:phosphatidylserine decarboxylase